MVSIFFPLINLFSRLTVFVYLQSPLLFCMRFHLGRISVKTFLFFIYLFYFFKDCTSRQNIEYKKPFLLVLPIYLLIYLFMH